MDFLRKKSQQKEVLAKTPSPLFVPVSLFSLRITLYGLTYCPFFNLWVQPDQCPSPYVVSNTLASCFSWTQRFPYLSLTILPFFPFVISLALPLPLLWLLALSPPLFFSRSLHLCFPIQCQFLFWRQFLHHFFDWHHHFCCFLLWFSCACYSFFLKKCKRGYVEGWWWRLQAAVVPGVRGGVHDISSLCLMPWYSVSFGDVTSKRGGYGGMVPWRGLYWS